CAFRDRPGAKAPGPPHTPGVWRPRPWVLRRVICREVDPSVPFGSDQTVVLPALSRVGSRNTRGLLVTVLQTGITFLVLVTVVVVLFLARDVPPFTLLRVGLQLTLGIVRIAVLGLGGFLGRFLGGFLLLRFLGRARRGQVALLLTDPLGRRELLVILTLHRRGHELAPHVGRGRTTEDLLGDTAVELQWLTLKRLRLTAVDNCGVYPTNQADTASLEVPVLPATGRPSGNAALDPPPFSTTCVRAWVASAATSLLTTSVPFASSSASSGSRTLPSRSTSSVTMCAGK